MAKILVINGPNLNLLGKREPEIYGATTPDDLNSELRRIAAAAGHSLEVFQSNSEGNLIDRIQSVSSSVSSSDWAFIIINAAALTHTSIGLRDALKLVGVPFVEVHISNIYARESFRHHSYLSGIARGVICGFGVDGYVYALRFAIKEIQLNS